MITMKKIRFYLAIIVARMLSFALKVIKKRGTHMPGVFAFAICPEILSMLEKPETLICVTGTNGKTSVSNMITDVFKKSGYAVTNNSYGSNIREGVITTLVLNSTLSGKHKNKVAVLEVDERSSLNIYPYMAPDYLVCNNIMRDSQKRNAHTDFISYIITKALPETTKVVLNADDIICSHLAPQCKNRTYFALRTEIPEKSDSPYVRDIVYCPECGAPLKVDYLRYNHIGSMHCENCDFKNPSPDYFVTAVDRENRLVSIEHEGKTEKYTLVNDNIVNVYNLCGVVSLCKWVGLTYEQISKSLESTKLTETRFTSDTSNGVTVTRLLSKGQNPIACTRCYSYTAKCPGENKAVLVMEDDVGDNTNDSESVCWLYDCDYSFFKDESIGLIVFSGPRCRDKLLRAAINGVDTSKILTAEGYTDGCKLIDTKEYKNIYILHDNYLLNESLQVRDYFLGRGKI